MTAQHDTQAQISAKTKDLVILCKTVLFDDQRSRTNLRAIDALHNKSRHAKLSLVNKSRLNLLCRRALGESEAQTKLLLDMLENISTIKALERDLRLSVAPRSFRRGALMSFLQESAKCIPLWVGLIGQKAPPLCGAVPAEADSFAEPGDQVAALVPEPDVAATTCSLSEGCILAEVVDYNKEKQTYQIEDVDAEEGRIPKRYDLARDKIIRLPKWKANPVVNPEAIFRKGDAVLALYPQTTCFYKAVVDETPSHVHDEYSLFFEDSTYPEGYAPAIKIPQRYVVAYHDSDNSRNDHASSRRRPK